jgi:phosphatidylserine/phosphatidylglycerophosphate/cardiolipin synthase-like enzyme
MASDEFLPANLHRYEIERNAAMTAFFSPVDPTEWALNLTEITVPTGVGMRYAGLRLPAVRGLATGAAAAVSHPITGIARLQKLASTLETWVQSQLIPFPVRNLINALPFGIPTFYLVFDPAASLTLSPDHDCPVGGNNLLVVTGSFTIAMIGQDRIVRDPILWASEIADAINAVGGGVSSWDSFVTAVNAISTAATTPLRLLGHNGQPVTSGSVELSGGPTTFQVTLTPADGGDLTSAVRRARAMTPPASPVASPWDLPGLVVRPLSLAGAVSDSVQLAGVEDGVAAAREIQVSATRRHLMFTDLNAWFAPQTASPAAGAPSPWRFQRGNRLRTFVNGPEYFDDWLRLLYNATGLHLAAWDVWPDVTITSLKGGDPADLPLTLAQAAVLIGGRAGSTRINVLASRFYQLQDPTALTPLEALLLGAIIVGMYELQLHGVDAVASNTAGYVVLLLAWFAAVAATSYIIDTGAEPLEPNRKNGAFDKLNSIPKSTCVIDSYPALQVDNPRQQALPTLGVVDHWGIFHQKLSVVRTANGHSGFCGGIDVNPDRLDDARHLAIEPFHDVHARVDGPAVADLARTFEERWDRASNGVPLAFPTPSVAALAVEVAGDPAASNAIQVARTYFAPAAGAEARAFPFAATGDHTIHDTLVTAIASAMEFIYIEDQYLTPPPSYIAALVAVVQSRSVKRLIIVVPALADQPFGEIVRSGLVDKLRAVDDPTDPIVRVGYPRLRFRLPEISMQAESGRVTLGAELPAGAQGNGQDVIVIGPPSRLPAPPYWVCCEGEYIWVYDETALPGGLDSHQWRAFLVDRGGDTKLVSTDKFSTLNPRTRAHAIGAPVSMVTLSSVYVHAKTMIIDDCFLSVGSANLNRRGMFHDGEANLYVVPEPLRTRASNPVAALRRRLWAEMLDLPEDLALPLLQDPVAAADLFSRSPLLGNRFVDIGARPTNLSLDVSTGDGIVGNIIGALGFSLGIAYSNNFYNTAVDPTSSLDPQPLVPAP